MAKFLIFALSLVALCLISETEAAKRMVCYYGGWSPYRPGNGEFLIENIDPYICTHLMYGFAALNDDGTIKVYDPWMDLPDDYGKAGYRRMNDLKKINPSLKCSIAIGGWNEGSVRYSQVFSDPLKRQVFVNDAVSFLQKHGFDGLDLDWEYPGQRGGSTNDVAIFSSLIKELRAEFDKYGYILTAAVAAAELSFTQSYEIPILGQYLDFINIMAYDYHGAWENVTGHNAPIYIASTEVGTNFSGYSAHASIQAWLEYGAPADKLVMGVGLYGRAFTLASTNCIAPRCPAKGAGLAGPFTGEAGMLGYNEICLKEATGAKFWDDEAKVPYLVEGDQWVGYDDEESARLKVEYIKNNNLGGAMVWSIDTDDFRGSCGKGKYPLLSILKSGMDTATNNPPAVTTTTAVPVSTTTAAPATTTTAAPATTTTAAPATTTTAAPATTTTAAPATTTTAAPATTTTAAPVTTTSAAPASTTQASSEPCIAEGYNRDSVDCAVFYQCTLTNGKWKYTRFQCSGGLLFDTTQNVCNFAANVEC